MYRQMLRAVIIMGLILMAGLAAYAFKYTEAPMTQASYIPILYAFFFVAVWATSMGIIAWLIRVKGE